jgi:ABC-type branched-subunit amino acid transport system permease subunit
MSTSAFTSMLLPGRNTRLILVKWIVALLVPFIVFFVWSGESILNAVISPGTVTLGLPNDPVSLIEAGIFISLLFLVVFALIGYLIAADSGRKSTLEVWIDVALYIVVPLLLVIETGLIIGLALSAIVWPLYIYVRNQVRKVRHYDPPTPLANIRTIDAELRVTLIQRAMIGGFWFASVVALITLVVDIIYYFTGSLTTLLLIVAIIRTLLLPVLGYWMGWLGGVLAAQRTLTSLKDGNGGNNGNKRNLSNLFGLRATKATDLQTLSTSRISEKIKDIVPNDQPLRSTGAQRLYLILLGAFVLFYPVIDPFLFSFGTNGRLAGYGDAGFYVILALGLNIVVGFAGLLDLGYVAFFAIGAYAWGMIGSTQLTNILNLAPINSTLLSSLFWPMIIVAALIAALCGVILGAPTLRLRGDYLAIVTLGFGEIVPIVFKELDKITNGTNGIVGVQSPAFFGIQWSTFTPTPYYYLILALIGLTIFANLRLRDSRLGRAWIAMREDEIAAASSGINLISTKLFAFGAGAFFSGIAGAYHAAKLGGVSPDDFGFGDSVIYLAMVVIGGIGSIPGVIVGAFAVYSINLFILAQLDSIASDPTNFLHTVSTTIAHYVPGFTFGNIRNLVFGIVLVTIMIFRPEGLIPSARRRRELHAEDTAEELGSLGTPPGSPGFEAEARIE